MFSWEKHNMACERNVIIGRSIFSSAELALQNLTLMSNHIIDLFHLQSSHLTIVFC